MSLDLLLQNHRSSSLDQSKEAALLKRGRSCTSSYSQPNAETSLPVVVELMLLRSHSINIASATQEKR